PWCTGSRSAVRVIGSAPTSPFPRGLATCAFGSPMFAALALTALCLEAAFGYPDALYRRIGHPVTWLGALIAWCDRRWNSHALKADRRRLNGVATLVLLVAVAALVGLAIWVGATRFVSAGPGLVVTALAASSLLAQRSLYT